MNRWSFIALIASLTGLVAPATSQAALFTVTKTADTNGTCQPANCSLREAINAANAAGGPDDIAVPDGTYALIGGELTVSSDIAIKGTSAAGTIIDGGHVVELFEVTGESTVFSLGNLTLQGGRGQNGSAINSTAQSVTLDTTIVRDNEGPPTNSGLGTLKLAGTGTETLNIRNSALIGNTAGGNGHNGFGPVVNAPSGANGAVISVDVSNSVIDDNRSGGGGGAGFGGAFVLGAGHSNVTFNLTIADSTFSNNRAGGAGGFGFAGAIDISSGGANVTHNTTITNSTFSGNIAGGDGPGVGGALDIGGGGANLTNNIQITNSTFHGNSSGGPADNGSGGALSVGSPTNGTRTITNSTISTNSALGPAGLGGGISGAAKVTLKNTIVSGNTASIGANCDAQAVSAGGNIENLNTCGLTGTGDKPSTDPLLGPLAGNGGPTQTQALLSGSPALDAGVNCPPPATDQRGVTRPQGPACDSGAYEQQVVVPISKVVPVLSKLRFSPTKFRARGRGGSIISARKKRKRAKVGANVSYLLSENATVKFTVERKLRGRKKGKKCSTTRKRGKRCTTYKRVKGSFTHASKSGANRFKFSGRMRGKKLRPGSYRLIAKPSDATGNGKAQAKAFKIVR